MEKLPIILTVFIHEDLKGINQDDLYQSHFDWLVEKIEGISGRTVSLDFVFPSDAPSMSGIYYKTEDLPRLLESMDNELEVYLSEQGSDHTSIRKYLLLTRDAINSNTLGVAYTPGNLGIATVHPSVTASHEFGHMFNARHEDSDANIDTYYGPAKSLMQATAEGTIAFALSKKNRENIRDYLDQYN